MKRGGPNGSQLANLGRTAWGLYLSRSDTLSNHPVSVQIGISSKCNLACEFCYTIRPDRELAQSHLSTKCFTDILDHPQVRNCIRVALSGGEPFLHPEIDELLRIGRARRKILTVYTNGLLLTKRGMKVTQDPPDAVCMSIYPDHFEKQGASMRAWLDEIPPARRPVVICSTIASKSSLDFLETAFGVAEVVGAELLFIQNLIPRFSELEDAVWTTDRDVIARITSIRKRFASRVPSTAPVPLDAGDSGMHCRQVFQYLSVNTDGNITPCCGIYAFDNEFGNVFKGEDIWNSDFHRAVRRSYRGSSKEMPSACRNCYMRHHEYTQIATEGRETA